MKIKIIDEERLGTKGYNGYEEIEVDIYKIGAISGLTKKIYIGKNTSYRLTKNSFKSLKTELLKHDATKDLILGM